MRKGIAKGGGAVAVIGIVLLVIGAILFGITAEHCQSAGWWIFEAEACTTYHPYAGVGALLILLGIIMAIIGGIVALVGAAMREEPPPWRPCPNCQRSVNGRFCPYCGTRVI